LNKFIAMHNIGIFVLIIVTMGYKTIAISYGYLCQNFLLKFLNHILKKLKAPKIERHNFVNRGIC